MLFLARLPVVKYKNADESTNSEAGNGGTNSDSNSDPDTTDSPPTKRHKASKQQVKKKAKEAENMAKYQEGVDHHKSLQDKATQKRMKKNLKRAEKQSWGKNVPWYKRWFRKKRI